MMGCQSDVSHLSQVSSGEQRAPLRLSFRIKEGGSKEKGHTLKYTIQIPSAAGIESICCVRYNKLVMEHQIYTLINASL